MMDRYLDEKIELDIKLRAGSKFIKCAQDIYLKLIPLQFKQVKINEELHDLKLAIDDLMKVYGEYEDGRESFTVPASVRDDYDYAYKRYLSIKNNPNLFYQKEGETRAALLHEKEKLSAKILIKKDELDRAEMRKRKDLQELQLSLAEELISLNAKKKRYLSQQAAANRQYFPMCYRKYEKMLPIVSDRIGVVEVELTQLHKKRCSAVEELESQLSGMQNRSWEIDKELIKLEDKPRLRVLRRQSAIDKAEVECQVRRMDIDDSLNRHYCAYPQQIIYYFLKVYYLAKNCHNKISIQTDITQNDYECLSDYANQLNCPELTNRSVKNLARKLDLLTDVERLTILTEKPTTNHLPEELLRTFSIAHLRDSTDLIKLFKGYFPPNPLVDNTTLAYTPRAGSKQKK